MTKRIFYRMGVALATLILLTTMLALPIYATTSVKLQADENGFYPSFNELKATYGEDAQMLIEFEFNESADTLGVYFDVCTETRCLTSGVWETFGFADTLDYYAKTLDQGGDGVALYEERWHLVGQYGFNSYTITIFTNNNIVGDTLPFLDFLRELPQGLKNSFNGFMNDGCGNLTQYAISGLEWLIFALASGVVVSVTTSIILTLRRDK